ARACLSRTPRDGLRTEEQQPRPAESAGDGNSSERQLCRSAEPDGIATGIYLCEQRSAQRTEQHWHFERQQQAVGTAALPRDAAERPGSTQIAPRTIKANGPPR